MRITATEAGWLGIDIGMWAAVITILAAVATFVVGEVIKSRSARQDRRRKVAETWLDAATAIIDAPETNAIASSSTQASRLALNVSPRQEYVAYWAYEMLFEISRCSSEVKSGHPNALLYQSQVKLLIGELGMTLVRWHHGELNPRHFAIPYKLRARARQAHEPVHKIAEALGLLANVSPFKYRVRDRVAILLRVGFDVHTTWWMFYPALTRREQVIADHIRFQQLRKSKLVRYPLIGGWLDRWESFRLRLFGPVVDRVVAWIWRPDQSWPPGASAGA